MTSDPSTQSFAAVRAAFETGDYDEGMDALTSHLEAHGPPADQDALQRELADALVAGALTEITGTGELEETDRRLEQALEWGVDLEALLERIESSVLADPTNLHERRRASAALGELALGLRDPRSLKIATALTRLDPARESIWLELALSALSVEDGELADQCFAHYRAIDPKSSERLVPIVQACLTQDDPERAIAQISDDHESLPAPTALELGATLLLAGLEEPGSSLFRLGISRSEPADFLAVVFSLTAIDLALVDEALAELPVEKQSGPHYPLCRAHRLIIQGDMVSGARWLEEADRQRTGYRGDDAEQLQLLGALLHKGLVGYEEEEMVRLVAFSGASLERTHAWLDSVRP